MAPINRRQFLAAAASAAACTARGAATPRSPARAPWQLTARQAATRLRAGTLTSTALVRSCLRRIDEGNPHVNALNFVDAEGALRAAAEADKALTEGRSSGPLHGIPVAIKDNTDVRGQPMTNGVVALRDNIAIADAPQITRLRQAGAVLLGRSNTPCFSFSWDARNDLHGTTWNPWSPLHTPGGSSGGAACAVATGMVPLAQGNDIGGSIRYPAYCCGVPGLRPTPGRIPGLFSPVRGEDALGLQLMLVEGPIARCVDDLRLMLDGFSGFDPRVAGSIPLPFPGSTGSQPPVIGVLREDAICPRSATVSAALERAVIALQAAGYRVQELRVPELEEAWRLWWLLVMEETRALLPDIERDGDAPIKAWIRYNYAIAAEMWGPHPTLSDYIRGYTRRAALIGRVQQTLQSYPILLLPVANDEPMLHGQHYASLPAARMAIASGWPLMALPVLGFPSLVVPTGLAEGLPTGVQLMGRRFHEQDVLRIGEVIEAAMPRLTPMEPVGG